MAGISAVAGPSTSPSAAFPDPFLTLPLTPLAMRPPRTLVLCFDGTSNEYDANVRTATRILVQEGALMRRV